MKFGLLFTCLTLTLTANVHADAISNLTGVSAAAVGTINSMRPNVATHSREVVVDKEKGVRRTTDIETFDNDFLFGSARAVSATVNETPLPKPSEFDQAVQAPFNAPKCKSIMKVPANQDGVYASEDCSTAFVMPDQKGKITVSNLSTSSSMALCDSLYVSEDTETRIDSAILKYEKMLEELDPADPKFTKITDAITKLSDMVPKLYTNYEKVVAGNAQIIFSTSDEQSRLKEFMWENADAVKNNSLQIQAAPIQESYISFSSANADLKRPRILDFTMSGVKPNSKTSGQLDQNIYRSGLNASASLTLSLWGLCPGKDKRAIAKDKITLNVSPVITYTVPVLAWAGYHAELNNSQAISNIMTIAKTHGQFSNTDVEKYSLSGGAESGMTFRVIDTGLKSVYDADDQKGFFTNLREAVFLKLNNRLIEQMAQSGLVQLATPSTGIEAPPAGFRDETRQGEDSCSSSWFGMSHSCSPTFYTVKIPVTSTGDSVIEKYPDVQFKNVDEVQVRQPVTSVHTIIFDAPEVSANNSSSVN